MRMCVREGWNGGVVSNTADSRRRRLGGWRRLGEGEAFLCLDICGPGEVLVACAWWAVWSLFWRRCFMFASCWCYCYYKKGKIVHSRYATTSPVTGHQMLYRSSIGRRHRKGWWVVVLDREITVSTGTTRYGRLICDFHYVWVAWRLIPADLFFSPFGT